jgi:hypothetical protein
VIEGGRKYPWKTFDAIVIKATGSFITKDIVVHADCLGQPKKGFGNAPFNNT